MADEAGKRERWLSMPEKRSGYHPRVADKETEVPGSKWLGGDTQPEELDLTGSCMA